MPQRKTCQYPGCFNPPKKKKGNVFPLPGRPPRYCEEHLYQGRYRAHVMRKGECNCDRDYLTVPLEHADYCTNPRWP